MVLHTTLLDMFGCLVASHDCELALGRSFLNAREQVASVHGLVIFQPKKLSRQFPDLFSHLHLSFVRVGRREPRGKRGRS